MAAVFSRPRGIHSLLFYVMTDSTSFKFRYKLPSINSYWATQSFGIEPYFTRKDGRQIKAGKSIIRCRIHNSITKSCGWAQEAADRLIELLNAGHVYRGPKNLSFDKPIDVEGYFHD